METVGRYLKKERESKNISLHELAQLTKISEPYLEYIEKDEFEKLPQGPYVKGYIASYSRLIGGNVDEALKRYEILNSKETQTEHLQPEIAKQIVKQNRPEKPKTKDRKKPKAPRWGVVKSSSDSLVSSGPTSRFSFNAAETAIKKLGSSLRINRNGFDTAVSFGKKIALSRSWLYALIALLGIGILALAGFGFYHLFIYDPDSLSVSQLQHVQDKQARPLPAMGSEKSILPSEATDASPTADQRDDHANTETHLAPTSRPAAQTPAATVTTDMDEAIARIEPAADNSSATNDPALQSGTPLSVSSSTAEKTTAASESQVRSDQGGLTADSSPEPTSADAQPRVLQASVCAEIKNRMPIGVDTSFPTSAQRVFVWSEIEAEQVPSEIRHIYYFNGQKISDVALDVRSAYWRTWSFKNISDDRYRGEWRVDIATSSGKVLRRLYFVVR